jgi:hypothetical protein
MFCQYPLKFRNNAVVGQYRGLRHGPGIIELNQEVL